MPDKKVSKSVAARPSTPSQKLDASLSDTGTVNMAEPTHDRARSTLVDKFKEREERWRRDQALHEHQGEGVASAEAGSGVEAAVEQAAAQGEGAGPRESGAASRGGES